MAPPRAASRWFPAGLALAGIVLVALSLRTAVAAISPIASEIDAELGFGPLALAVIGSVPPLAFAVGGLVTPILVRRWGLETTAIVAVAVIAVGHVARAAAPSTVALIGATVVTLLGVGVGNVLLPPLVKRYFATRVGALTALYAAIISLSTAVPAWIAVPVADSAGWRVSLGIWFVVALLALPPWIAVVAGHRRELRRLQDAATSEIILPPAERPVRGVWRSPTAVAIMLVFGVSSTLVYTGFAWFPALLVETAGVTAAESGALLALFALAGIPMSFLAPFLASKLPSVVPLIVYGFLAIAGGALGLLLAPAAAPALWMVVLGTGAILFPLALYLISVRSRTPAGAVATSGFAQAAGYVIGALGPLVFGALHDSTGAWTASVVFLAAIGVLVVPGAVILARPRTVEDDLEARAG